MPMTNWDDGTVMMTVFKNGGKITARNGSCYASKLGPAGCIVSNEVPVPEPCRTVRWDGMIETDRSRSVKAVSCGVESWSKTSNKQTYLIGRARGQRTALGCIQMFASSVFDTFFFFFLQKHTQSQQSTKGSFHLGFFLFVLNPRFTLPSTRKNHTHTRARTVAVGGNTQTRFWGLSEITTIKNYVLITTLPDRCLIFDADFCSHLAFSDGLKPVSVLFKIGGIIS